jgi:tetratricopeptide (TPR) repeat protein
LFDESEKLYREAGHPVHAAEAMRQHGLAAGLLGDYRLATALLEQTLVVFKEAGYVLGIARSLEFLGETKYFQGDTEQAVSLLEQSLTLCREFEITEYRVLSMLNLGKVFRASGDYLRASNLYKESLVHAKETGYKKTVVACVHGLGLVCAFLNHPERAARLLAAAETLAEHFPLRPPLGPEKADHDRALAAVRAALEDGAFRTAWAEGRAMTLGQAVEHALDAGTEPTGNG